MKCEYCGRRVPGRLVVQGIKNCQGCGAELPKVENEPDCRTHPGVISWSLTYTYYEPKKKKV